MKYNYKPKTNLEKFGIQIHNLLVENFPQTFFVGGMVRDILLGRKITDIDIATSAAPEKILNALSEHGIKADKRAERFGVVSAVRGAFKIEITTFRRDFYSASRYPKISFVKSPEADSRRRDFTVNSLYFSPKTAIIHDYNKGLRDISERLMRFIGTPQKRIQEDPLRIVRALRFAQTLNFKLEKNTFEAVRKNLFLANTLTSSRVANELSKIKSPLQRKIILSSLKDKKILDKHFKSLYY